MEQKIPIIINSYNKKTGTITCDFFDGGISSKRFRLLIDPKNAETEKRSMLKIKGLKLNGAVRKDKQYYLPEALLNPSIWKRISEEKSLIFSYVAYANDLPTQTFEIVPETK